MHIIPVIDLMHGQVVQAIQGQRQHYRPIQSRLTDSHALLDVVAAILQVYPFDCVYIADLNAITCNTTLPNHRADILAAMQAFPQLTWWVDAGINSVEALAPWQEPGIRPVIASEVIPDLHTYQTLRDKSGNSILSLDFFKDGFHGPAALLSESTDWTSPAIVMSLTSVGANAGPDLHRMHAMQQLAADMPLYAAGGVRHMADIRTLSATGTAGVLIASALHQKRITASDLIQFGEHRLPG